LLNKGIIVKNKTQTWVLALTALASFMVALDALVVSTALSTIRLDLHASVEQLEWTVNGYSLSFAVLLMTGAALGDRFGRRRMFVAGLGLFVAASALCALAPAMGTLIAARALQGCGAALVMPLAVTQLSVAVPPEQRARALGIFSGVTGLAVLAGPVVGGAIAQGLAWQWIFWLNVPIGLLLVPLVLRRIPESFGPRTVLDIGGLLLITGAALGVVWGLVRGNQAGWGSLEVVAALAAGVLLTVAFVAWERRVRAPMLPLRFFRSRAFSAGNAAGFLFFASLYGSTFFLAQFFQVVLGYGPLGTGLRLLPWTIMLFVSAPIAGNLVSRFGERTLLVGGLLSQAVAMAWIGLIARPGLAYPELIAPVVKLVRSASSPAVIGPVCRRML
jgi:EmrB/QacA subfamily drug resistance transporter